MFDFAACISNSASNSCRSSGWVPARYPITGLSAWVEPSRDELADLIDEIIGQTEKALAGD